MLRGADEMTGSGSGSKRLRGWSGGKETGMLEVEIVRSTDGWKCFCSTCLEMSFELDIWSLLGEVRWSLSTYSALKGELP